MFTPQQFREQNTAESLPHSVALTLKGYAVISFILSLFFLLSTLVVNSTSSFFEYTKTFWEMLTGSDASLLGGAIFLIPILYFILLTVYYIGLFRLRRWTVVVTMVLVTGIVLKFMYGIFVAGNATLPHAVGAMVGVAISVSIAVLSVRYRTSLQGSGKKLAIQIPIILALLPAILFTALSLIFVDNKTLDDASVVPVDQPVLSDAQNAYLALVLEDEMTPTELTAFEKVSDLYRQATSFEEIINLEELQAVVADTRRISDAFITASNLSGVQCPGYVNDRSPNAQLCKLNTIRTTAHLLYLRVVNSSDQHDYQDAVTANLALIKFAHLYEEVSTNGSLIEYLVSSAVRGIGYDTAWNMLGGLGAMQHYGFMDQSVKDEFEHELYSVIAVSEPSIEALTDAMRAEYGMMKYSFKELEIVGHGSYVWHPNRTLQKIADVTGLHIEHQLQACGSAEEQLSLQKLEDSVSRYDNTTSLYAYLLRPNAVGEILNSVTISTLSHLKENYCAMEKTHNDLLVGSGF